MSLRHAGVAVMTCLVLHNLCVLDSRDVLEPLTRADLGDVDADVFIGNEVNERTPGRQRDLELSSARDGICHSIALLGLKRPKRGQTPSTTI